MPSVAHVRRAAEWNRRRYRRAWGPAIRTEPLTITFPETPLRSRCWIALNADLTQSHLTWSWTDITEYVRWEQGISIDAGRRDQSDEVDASEARLTVTNDGRFSRKNPFGPWFGLLTRHTPIWLAADPGSGYADRYFGFVNEWPKRWDRSGNDSTVGITCRGLLHQLTRRQPLRSPLFYTISGASEGDYVPHVYIPLEDGENATRAASGLPGGTPATVLGDVTFASDTDLAGSGALPFLDSGSHITTDVPAYTDTEQWVIQVVLRVDAEPAAVATYLEVETPGGPAVIWRLQIEPGSPSTIYWRGVDSAGALVAGSGVALSGDITEDDFYGRWWFYTLTSYMDGGEIWGGISITDDGDFQGFASGTNGATTHAAARKIRLHGGEGVAAGHLALFIDPAFNVIGDALDNADAMGAWDGEMAHERMERLCREQRIPFFCLASTSAALGRQPTGKLIDVLRDAEKADQGVLFEHQFGLGYQALSERYNRTVQFELDIAQGHLTEDLEPDDSDLRFRNQWTARRTDGSEVTVQGRDGVSGAELDSTEAIYPGQDTFGVLADDQLDDLAGWLAHRDSVDDDYWPNVGFNLAKHPALIPTWLELGYGARMTVDNVMDEAGIDQLDLIIEGYRERWNSKEWDVTLNTSPAGVFTVLELDDPVLGRLDSGSSTLVSDVAASASSFLVTSSDPYDRWTTDAAEFPLDVKIAGIDVTVTSITSALADTFTRTESNGWGTSDTGQAWTVSGGAASDYDVNGTTARMSLGSLSTLRTATVSTPSLADLEITGTVSNAVVPTGDNFELHVRVRHVDGNNFLDMRLFLSTSNTVSIAIRQVISGAETVTGFPAVPRVTATTQMKWRLQASGSTLRARAWNAAHAEPTAWLASMTTSWLTAGGIQLAANLASSVSNALPVVISWDDVNAVDPQTFTVTGATVTKALAAGEEVHIATDVVLAL